MVQQSEKIQLKILGITTGSLSSSYTLLLEEVNGDRKLPIVIGVMEAQSIAIEIEKIEPVRPLTHDLFRTLCQSFNLRVKEVIIHKLHEGIFYAYLVVTDGIEIKNIDSRTSDAIALALRFNSPIYAYASIMDEAGISIKASEMKDYEEPDEEMDDEMEEEVDEEQDFEDGLPDEPASKEEPINISKLDEMSISSLKTFLEKAIRDEDYFLAAKIRDAIKKKDERKS